MQELAWILPWGVCVSPPHPSRTVNQNRQSQLSSRDQPRLSDRRQRERNTGENPSIVNARVPVSDAYVCGTTVIKPPEYHP